MHSWQGPVKGPVPPAANLLDGGSIGEQVQRVEDLGERLADPGQSLGVCAETAMPNMT
jgi:hypothetical protein